MALFSLTIKNCVQAYICTKLFHFFMEQTLLYLVKTHTFSDFTLNCVSAAPTHGNLEFF